MVKKTSIIVYENSNTSENQYDSLAYSKTDPNKKDKKLMKIFKSTNNWTREEDQKLLEVAKEFKCKNWKKISEHFEGRSAIQCSSRYNRIKPGIVKGSWNAEEDEKLLNYVKRFGKNWSLISKYMTSRSGKQIRDRYLNTLDSSILRERFTKEEDNKILVLYKKYGSSWSSIAKNFTGRTGDMIKNRFYSSLKKNLDQENIIDISLTDLKNEEYHDDECNQQQKIFNESNINDNLAIIRNKNDSHKRFCMEIAKSEMNKDQKIFVFEKTKQINIHNSSDNTFNNIVKRDQNNNLIKFEISNKLKIFEKEFHNINNINDLSEIEKERK